MAKGDVKILILGDATDAKKAFDDAAKHAEKFNGGVKNGFAETGKHADQLGSKVSSAGKVLGALGGMFAGGALFGFLNDSVQAASDLNETISKAKVVFGSAADSVLKMGDAAAGAMGMSKNEAVGAAATYGNLFRAMGMTEDASAGMSTKLVGLAGDLASFNNADPTEVLRALQSGLVGETEPLRTFGVSLSAARVEAEALRLGLVKGVKNSADVESANVAVAKSHEVAAEAAKKHGYNSMEYRDAAAKMAQAEDDLAGKIKGKVPDLDAATKAQATYSLILQDTTLAQGDFSRTSDGLANKTRIQKAEFENLKAEIGDKLLPVWVGAMGWMNVAADTVKQWWSDNGEDLKRKFQDTFGTDPIQNFKNGLKEAGAIFDDLKGRATNAYSEFERGSVMVYNTIGPAWEWLGDKLLWVKDKVLDPVWGFLQGIPGGLAKIFGDVKGFLDPIVGVLQTIVDKMNVITNNPFVSGLFGSTGAAASFFKNMLGGKATGGILPDGMSLVGELGPELAVTQGGQTRIVPNQQSNLAGGGWGAWGGGKQVNEDGSYAGMPDWAKKAQSFMEHVQRQDAMRANPALQGRPGWGSLAPDPFAGWDAKADFSNWGKAPAMPPRQPVSKYDEPRQQGTTETINLILDGEVIASHIRRRELQIR